MSDDISISPIEYWNLKRKKWPILAKFARKYVGLIPSETPSESQFIITGYFDLNYKRNRIRVKKFKHLHFIKLRRLEKRRLETIEIR